MTDGSSDGADEGSDQSDEEPGEEEAAETPLEEVAEESPPSTPPEPAEEAPLADLARSMEEESEAPPEEDLFEEMEVSDLEAESVWETVAEGESEGAGPGSGGPGGAVEEIEPEGSTPEGEHVVDKRDFCHRCSYFTEPPETACAHEGTEIVEVVDSEHFRVRNCPMVGEDGRPNFEQG